MIIRQAKEEDIKNLYIFNSNIFPEKIIDSKKYIDFWLSKSKEEISNALLLTDEDNKLYGQILTSSMSFYYKKEKINTVWLFDLIVDEYLRKGAWGIDLLLKGMEIHPKSFSTGAGPTALPLHKKLGNTLLGEIRKYVGIISPWYIPFSIKRHAISISKYPQKICVCQQEFTLTSADNLPELTQPFNDDLLEIARDKKYLEWRFFNRLHQYVFYLNNDCKSYFVLRSIELKGVRVMELVDYRCKLLDSNFEIIYQAVVKVTKSVHLPIVVCGSTLSTIDKILERHHFKSLGRPRPVLGFLKCKDRKQDIESRNFAYITLADSDGETNWI